MKGKKMGKLYIQKAFTLIELMIVIGIIGILAAIAVPAYQDYIAKSQVTEAFSLMNGLKGQLAEYYSANAVCPSNGSVGGAGSVASGSFPLDTTINGKYVKRVKVGLSQGADQCALWAEMRSSGVNNNIAGKLISLRMDVTSGSYQFSCYVNFPEKYAPSTCSYRQGLSIN